jgi:hypothetical protein
LFDFGEGGYMGAIRGACVLQHNSTIPGFRKWRRLQPAVGNRRCGDGPHVYGRRNGLKRLRSRKRKMRMQGR